ncbi:hypothetical protein EBZ37_10175 [bacterium]|nr:hypothetical protein [bacterium]
MLLVWPASHVWKVASSGGGLLVFESQQFKTPDEQGQERSSCMQTTRGAGFELSGELNMLKPAQMR